MATIINQTQLKRLVHNHGRTVSKPFIEALDRQLRDIITFYCNVPDSDKTLRTKLLGIFPILPNEIRKTQKIA